MEDLYQDDLDLGSLITSLDGVLDPWWDAKRTLNEKLGLQLQLSYQSLRQWVDQSPGEDEAAAGRFELQGGWTVLGRKTENPSVVTFRMEYRDTHGTFWRPNLLPDDRLGFRLAQLSHPVQIYCGDDVRFFGVLDIAAKPALRPRRQPHR